MSAQSPFSEEEKPRGARSKGSLRRYAELSKRHLFVSITAGTVLGVAVEASLGFFITSQPGLIGADRSILRRLALNRTPELTRVMGWLTILGGSAFVAVTLTLAAALVYRRTRQSRWPAFVAGTVVGNLGLDYLVKLVVGRPRPNFRALTEVTGSSFPSGHASTAAALFVSLAFLGIQWRRKHPGSGYGLALYRCRRWSRRVAYTSARTGLPTLWRASPSAATGPQSWPRSPPRGRAARATKSPAEGLDCSRSIRPWGCRLCPRPSGGPALRRAPPRAALRTRGRDIWPGTSEAPTARSRERPQAARRSVRTTCWP